MRRGGVGQHPEARGAACLDLREGRVDKFRCDGSGQAKGCQPSVIGVGKVLRVGGHQLEDGVARSLLAGGNARGQRCDFAGVHFLPVVAKQREGDGHQTHKVEVIARRINRACARVTLRRHGRVDTPVRLAPQDDHAHHNAGQGDEQRKPVHCTKPVAARQPPVKMNMHRQDEARLEQQRRIAQLCKGLGRKERLHRGRQVILHQAKGDDHAIPLHANRDEGEQACRKRTWPSPATAQHKALPRGHGQQRQKGEQRRQETRPPTVAAMPHIPLGIEQDIDGRQRGDEIERFACMAPEPDSARQCQQQDRVVPKQPARRTNGQPVDARQPGCAEGLG